MSVLLSLIVSCNITCAEVTGEENRNRIQILLCTSTPVTPEAQTTRLSALNLIMTIQNSVEKHLSKHFQNPSQTESSQRLTQTREF